MSKMIDGGNVLEWARGLKRQSRIQIEKHSRSYGVTERHKGKIDTLDALEFFINQLMEQSKEVG